MRITHLFLQPALQPVYLGHWLCLLKAHRRISKQAEAGALVLKEG